MSDNAEATQPKGPAKKKGASNAKKTLLLWTLALLPVSVVIWPTVLMAFLTMLPTLGAYLFEREKDKYFTISIGLPNLCGTLPTLATLWHKGHDYEAVTFLMHDGLTWLLPYTASALALGVYTATDTVIAAYYRATAHQKIRTLRRRQKLLIDEWGPEVISAEYDEDELGLEEDEEPTDASVERDPYRLESGKETG